jgi:hypothetical protein
MQATEASLLPDKLLVLHGEHQCDACKHTLVVDAGG